MMGLLKNSSNPTAMLQSMAADNPQMKYVMDYVNANGGDPKAAFYKMAQEKGVNPDSIISMLNSNI